MNITQIVALASLLCCLVGCKSADGPIEWSRHALDFDGLKVSAELVAQPEAVEGGYVAVGGNYATNIIAVEGSEIADLLANPSPTTGPQLAHALSGAIDGVNASFKKLNVEVAGMTGISFKIDGSGPGGRGQLRLVSSGGGGLAFICGTRGSFGVGKRINRLNSEVCPHFFSNAWTE